MRYLPPVSIVLSLLICFPAHATLISLSPHLEISRNVFFDNGTSGFETVPLEVDNLSIINSGSSTSSTGSGTANASVRGGGPSNSVSISTGLLSGPGSARATALSSSTFDLLFPRPGFYYIEAIVEINGRLDIDPDDNGFAFWEIFFEYPSDNPVGNNGIFGDSFGNGENPFECLGRGCQFDFAVNQGFLGFQVSKTRRIPVAATIFFDIGVSRITAVSEPNMIVLLVFGLMLLAFMQKKINPTSARIPSTRKAHSSAAFHVQADAPSRQRRLKRRSMSASASDT